MQGSRGYIGIKKETTWGEYVEAGDNDVFLPFVSESLTQNIEEVMSAIQRGIVDEPISYQGEKSFVGDIVVEVHPKSIGHILRSAMGIPSPTGTKVDTTETVVNSCEAVWSGGSTIIKTDATDKKKGDYSVKIQVPADIGESTVLAYANVVGKPLNISAATQYKFWIKSSIDIVASKLVFRMTEETDGLPGEGNSDDVNIPELKENVWKEVTVDTGTLTGFDNIQTCAIATAAGAALAEYELHVDHVRMVVAGEADKTTQHIFKPMQDPDDEFSVDCPLYPYTLDIYRDQGVPFRYLGSAVNTLALNFSATDKVLKATLGIIAKTIGDGTGSEALSLETTNPFVWDKATITISDKDTVPATGAMNDIESFSLTLDNVCAAKYALNHSDIPRKIIRTGVRTIPVSFTIEFLNRTEYAKFVAGTERSFTIKFVGAKPTDENKEAFYTLQIDLPLMRYLTYPINISGPGPITCAVTGKAKYYAESGYNYPLMVTLHNIEDLNAYKKA